MGKTQLVLELVYRTTVKQLSSSMFFMPAMNVESIRQAYRDVARELQIPG
jgi:hypothetical protein